MFKKSLVSVFAILCLTLLAFNNFSITAKADARAEIVMDVASGKILAGSNVDERLPMASTTKIMTAIIIIEDCDLDAVITVPDGAVGAEGSSVYLKHGEQISVKDLLYGLMLRSGNDCAAALAIYHSGTIAKFADRMNVKAECLGLKNTHFTNPSGLPDDKHFTSARDLGVIACYAMKNATFKEIVKTTNYTGEFRSYANKNKMLYNYEGATGIKTGYTVKAGRCLVSSAYKNGFEAVCVVLNCPDMYERSASLLDGCFKDYFVLKLNENKVFMCGKVPCKILKDCDLLVKKNCDLKYYVEEKAGEDCSLGILKIYSENDLIFEQKLYSINYEK